MKLTKYPQSCLVLDDGDGRILIDPGTVATRDHTLDDFGHVDAVLYTHRHADHLDPGIVDDLLERGVSLYGNADVRELLGADRATEVADGQQLEVAGFDVLPRDFPHQEMVDGSPGPPNTGYVIDGLLFHPGDAKEVSGLSVPNLAVPIAGPSSSCRDAYRMIDSVGAERAVPIHYDVFPEDPDLFAGFCDIAEVVVLGPGQSTEL